MAKTADQLVDEVIAREGGYVNHRDDRGGETNWGITKETARAHGYHGAMRDLPRAEAAEIYKRIYWLRPNLHLLAEIAPSIAEELFDTGVNAGPRRAIGFLQRALNVLNRRGRDYPDLVVDGSLGQQTLNAVRAFLGLRRGGEMVLLEALDALQGSSYIELAEDDPSQETFVYGWLAHRLGNVR